MLARWSGLAGDSVVVFNEVMYNPRDGDALEWVELHNQMAVDVEISNWEFDGISYTFPSNTIIPGGGYVVVASNPSELTRRAGIQTVFGPFNGRLANEGERLLLRNHNRRIMDELDYDTSAPWPVGADGSGFSLAKRKPSLASALGENWTTSAQEGGTPGAENFPAGISAPGFRFNEVAGSTDETFWIELVNTGSTETNLAGIEIEFSRAPERRVLLGEVTLEPGGLFVVESPGYRPSSGEKVFLYSAGRARLLDALEIEPRTIAFSGKKWGYPSTATPGQSNRFSLHRDIVINELMYANPAEITHGAWLELFNKGTNSVDLAGWRISGVDFSFPAGALILEPGEYLVVAEDSERLRAAYPEARIVGNFAGRLSRSSDHLVLLDALGNVADEVHYFDGEPWPSYADGGGASLELRDVRADNSKAEAWAAGLSPGEWRTYTYTSAAAADGGPTRWNEFIFGLLDAGEVLLDDFSVIEDPGGAARELLQNGGFEAGGSSWRFLGTHRNATVITDPDNPSNRVLHLAADGPTEHMHNHVETTLANNRSVRNGTTYQVSFRAKWLVGCNLLNTRLYFNRVAATTALQRPATFGTPGRRNSSAVQNIGPTFAQLAHSPVVPVANQPVQVSIHVSDPDGIKRCTLWAAPNGTNWTAVTMAGNGELYTASLPGRAAATVVQFYVEAEDNLGAISFYPAAGRASRALYKVNDGQQTSSRLHNFRLLMLPSEAALLHAPTNVMSNGRSLCTVIYDDREVFYDCGLHLQASQRGRMDPNRVGFTVSFHEDQLFRGVHDTITFDRSGGWSGRGGRHDEIVMRHIINQAGDSPDMYNDLVRVHTPLTTHSGTAMLLMAKYDDEFFDGSIYPPDGSLFKLELIYYPTTSVGNNPQNPKIPQPDEVIGIEIGNRGNDPEAYRWFYVAENNVADNDYSGLIALAQAFSLSGAALHQTTSTLMDMDQWTRTFAFKALSGDVDTYGFGLPHNQLFYIPKAGKALALPWDMDFAWTRSPSESILTGARVGQIFQTAPEYQRLYQGHLRDILDTSYNTNYVARWTAHYGSLVGQNYSGILSYIGQRAAAARLQLRTLASFRITSFSGDTFRTNATSMTLRGTAPYTYKRLQLNGNLPGAGFIWTGVDNWETVVPLHYGTNPVSIIAYDFKNRPVATNTVTIVSGPVFGGVDQDADGMADDWERQHGLDPARPDGAEDRDQDGASNLSEYLAGTDPADSASTLKLEAVTSGNQQLELSFMARANRSYRLQYRVATSSAWRDLLVVPPAAEDRQIAQPQTISVLAPALFYRLMVDVPDAGR